MNALKTIVLFWLIITGTKGFSQPGDYYPPPSVVNYHNDTLSICPPDSLPGEPVLLMGYNVFVDSIFYDHITVNDPLQPVDFLIPASTIQPGIHSFCAKSVYNDWISENTCDTATLAYGYELPFLEDWSSGDFEEQHWVSSGGNWIIDIGEGNPSPAAVFKGEPALANYEVSLESYPLNVLGIRNGIISIEFDIKLGTNRPTGNEKLWLQVWDWTEQEWRTAKQFDNAGGSFAWLHCLAYNMMPRNSICKVRYLAFGVNSADIQSWSIDNINIYRKCSGPYDLFLEENTDYNKLTWWGMGGGCFDGWLHWDDGNLWQAIGTGGAAEFDVAARWTPSQLADYSGNEISQISFVPFESMANYSVRIWKGEGAAELVYDSAVINPEIAQWNTVSLKTPIPVDATKELWVGYHINTQTGYPAGCDAGPAYDGYGNMMYYEGAWQTLLQINPDLNFNWNISCHIQDTPEPYWFYNIYRQTNSGDYLFYDTTPVATHYSDWTYLDTNINLSDFYCYSVSAVYIQYGDTCESTDNPEVCELIYGFDPVESSKSLKIYPNPAGNWLNIESEEAIRQIRIYSSLGILVMEAGTCKELCQIDVSSLRAGIYYLIMKGDHGMHKARFMIIR